MGSCMTAPLTRSSKSLDAEEDMSARLDRSASIGQKRTSGSLDVDPEDIVPGDPHSPGARTRRRQLTGFSTSTPDASARAAKFAPKPEVVMPIAHVKKTFAKLHTAASEVCSLHARA